MKRTPLAEMGISELLPPDLRRALIDTENWPPLERMQRIDKLTDEAARRGLVRERSCTALLARWQGLRNAQMGGAA